MAWELSEVGAFYFLLFLFSLAAPSVSETQQGSNVTVGTVCQSVPDPSYCKTVLPANQTGNIYYYGRFSVRKSLSQSQKFAALIDKYLSRRSSLSVTAIRTLEDCRLLADLNIDFLLSALSVANSANNTLSSVRADDAQSWLSAILTNQHTCLDGLLATASAWRIKNDVSAPLSNDTKLFSTSLALFTKGWVPRKKTRRLSWQTMGMFKQGKLTFEISSHAQKIYHSLSGRRLIESNGNQSLKVRDIVTVNLDGKGNFSSINDAIAAAPNKSAAANGYFLIYITAGVYDECVSVPKNKYFLIMMGDGINQTIITGNRSVADGWTTFDSATFAVVAPNFIATSITFRNTAGAIKNQAVALRSGADLSVFYRCSFEGYQDTLYVHSLRQFYRECDIYGTVDFIFGNAAVVFQNCNIYSRLPMAGQFNAITAQGRTDPNQNTGISIHNCTIAPASDLASNISTVKTYLGRPWKEYSRTVYLQSFIGSLVQPAGWREWNGDFALATLYYGEYNNSGPGSNTSSRVTWPGYHQLTTLDAANFTVSNFLLGDSWLPITDVPYTSGLI